MNDNVSTPKPAKSLVPENRQKLVYSAATFVIGLVLGGLAISATHKPAVPGGKPTDTVSIQRALDKITHGQVKLVSTFPAGRGYTGLEIQAPGMQHPAIAWALPDNDGLLLGDLFDLSGNNLNIKAATDRGLMPKNAANEAPVVENGKLPPPPPIINGLASTMASSGFVGLTEGSGPVRLDVFFDPNCIYCHRLWQSFQNDPNWRHEFTVNWIPVGFLKPDSAGKAAAILAGGINSLSENEQSFNDQTETGGIAASSDQAALSEVQHNTSQWMAMLDKYKSGQMGTPTVVINNDYIIESALNPQELSIIYRQLTEAAASTTKPATPPATTTAAPAAPAAATTVVAPQAQTPTSTTGGVQPQEPTAPPSPVVGPTTSH